MLVLSSSVAVRLLVDETNVAFSTVGADVGGSTIVGAKEEGGVIETVLTVVSVDGERVEAPGIDEGHKIPFVVRGKRTEVRVELMTTVSIGGMVVSVIPGGALVGQMVI